jgi:sugar lactone lactonase YvrE
VDCLAVDAATGFVYWTRGDLIARRRFGTVSGETLVSGLTAARGIALDDVDGWLYWGDVMTGAIERIQGDGSNREFLRTDGNLPQHVTVDHAGGFFYWTTTTGKDVKRATLDGVDTSTLIPQAGDAIGVAVDRTNGLLYWTLPSAGSIFRAPLNGGPKETVATGVGAPSGLAIDVANQTLYWADQVMDAIVAYRIAPPLASVLVPNVTNPRSIAFLDSLAQP